MRKRHGVGKAYLSIPKKRPAVTNEFLEKEIKESTFKPVINEKSNELCKNVGGRGSKERSIGEILMADGLKSKERILLAQDEQNRRLEKELTFKPYLFQPPANVSSKYKRYNIPEAAETVSQYVTNTVSVDSIIKPAVRAAPEVINPSVVSDSDDTIGRQVDLVDDDEYLNVFLQGNSDDVENVVYNRKPFVKLSTKQGRPSDISTVSSLSDDKDPSSVGNSPNASNNQSSPPYRSSGAEITRVVRSASGSSVNNGFLMGMESIEEGLNEHLTPQLPERESTVDESSDNDATTVTRIKAKSYSSDSDSAVSVTRQQPIINRHSMNAPLTTASIARSYNSPQKNNSSGTSNKPVKSINVVDPTSPSIIDDSPRSRLNSNGTPSNINIKLNKSSPTVSATVISPSPHLTSEFAGVIHANSPTANAVVAASPPSEFITVPPKLPATAALNAPSTTTNVVLSSHTVKTNGIIKDKEKEKDKSKKGLRSFFGV